MTTEFTSPVACERPQLSIHFALKAPTFVCDGPLGCGRKYVVRWQGQTPYWTMTPWCYFKSFMGLYKYHNPKRVISGT